MNDFGVGESTKLDDVKIGDITFKSVNIKTDLNDSNFYTYYYENAEGFETYVEIMSNSEDLPLNDPMMVEFIEGITLK